MQFTITDKLSNQIHILWWKKNSALDSQIVRAKENLELSHGGSSLRQASGTNQVPDARLWVTRIKALRQGRHWVWDLNKRRAIQEKS